MYGHKKSTNPTCAKSSMRFVITFANCPVLWVSKLQTETALSTMEEEIISLSHSCREPFPIMDRTMELSDAVGLPIQETTMNISIHDDNPGALVVAKKLPPEFTPRSKYYVIKTHFCEEICKRCIQVVKISTIEQLGDIFTKGLSRPTFEYLQKKLLGW